MSSSANLYGVAIGTASTAALGLSPIVTIRAPASTDIRGPGGPLKIGQIWVDTVANASYILTSFSSAAGVTTANWSLQGSTAGVLDTLSGDTGTDPVLPTAGNIELLGTVGQIITTGGASTITFSLDDPFIPPGDMEVTGNLTVDGTTDLIGLATVGALTQVGTASINATGAATTTIGSAAAGAISADTTAGITLNADAASSFTTTDAGADLSLVSTLGSVNITAGESAADSIVISSAIGGIDIIAAGAAAGEDIDITATGSSINLVSTEAAVANAIRLNASAADGGIDIDAGTGGITIDSTGAFSIDGAAASNVTTTGAGIDLTLSSSLGSVLVESTEDAALAIRLHANGGTSETIQIHSDLGTGVASLDLLSDVGGITLTAGLASADAINIVASAAGGGIDIDAGTAGIAVNAANGAIAINSGTGALGLSTDAAATAVSIGTGAGAKTVTVGSTNTTSATNLTAGSGGVNCATDFSLTTVATKISLNGGAATDFIGQATLTNGTVTVANTNIAATDRVFVNRSAVNASSALGVFKTVVTAATNFVITACKPADATTETGDASTVDYIIFRQT